MTNTKEIIEILTKLRHGFEILDKEIKESLQHLDEKQAELEADNSLLEDAAWCELYEYEEGYLAALKFCLNNFSDENL